MRINLSRDDVIKKITDVINTTFEENGFVLRRKRYYERTDSYGNTQQYEIRLSKRKGFFSLHLMLNILNVHLIKRVNSILEMVLRDESYEYPDNLDESIIEEIIKGRTTNYWLTGLTDEPKGWSGLDWKKFNVKKDEESFIWLSAFYEIEDIADWKAQLLWSVELAVEWFNKTERDDDWIISNTTYPSLLLLKEKKDFEKLEERYKYLFTSSKRHTGTQIMELELFYKYLMNIC